MKRSEAIELLSQLVYDNEHFDGHHYDIILDGLIAAGFQPPAVKEPCTTHVVNQLGQVIGVDESFVFVHRWESEDSAPTETENG